MNAHARSQRLERVYGAQNNVELEQVYDQWAGDYDQDVFSLGYTLPSVSAGFIGRYVPTSTAILDAGAGTGVIGAIMHTLGYDKIVGIDLSKGMLEKARSRNCYTDLRQMVLGEPLDFPSDTFDAVVSVGVFTTGHAPATAFDELVRVVKPGGWIIYTLRDDVYQDGGFKNKQQELETAGKWREVTVSRAVQPFPDTEPSIWHRVFVHQVV